MTNHLAIEHLLLVLAQHELSDYPVHPSHLGDLLPVKPTTIARCLTRALRESYVYWDATGWRLTVQGRARVQDTRPGSAARASNEREWKHEALTGMDKRGRRSHVTRGALPGPAQYVRPDDDETLCIEEMIDLLRQARREQG